MKIGIDIDGVLQDSERAFEVYTNIFDYDNNGTGVAFPNEYKASQRYEWSDEMFEGFVQKYMFDIMENAPIMPGAKDILQRLSQEGHKLYIITARGMLYKREEDIANNFLARLGVDFEGVHYACSDKLPACQQENIDYMIDDAPFNIQQLSENGVKCLYFRSGNAEDINHENVVSVANWGEVYRFFQSKK